MQLWASDVPIGCTSLGVHTLRVTVGHRSTASPLYTKIKLASNRLGFALVVDVPFKPPSLDSSWSISLVFSGQRTVFLGIHTAFDSVDSSSLRPCLLRNEVSERCMSAPKGLCWCASGRLGAIIYMYIFYSFEYRRFEAVKEILMHWWVPVGFELREWLNKNSAAIGLSYLRIGIVCSVQISTHFLARESRSEI